MTRMRKIRNGSAALIIGSLVFFSQLNAFSEDRQPLRVGIVLGLSGPASFWASYQRMGIELAKSELEASGRHIELYFEDSHSNTSAAVTAAKSLIQINNVDAIVGDVFGYITSALIPVATSAKIPLVTPALATSECEKGASPYVFRIAGEFENSQGVLKKLLERLQKERAAKTAALLTLDDPSWGAVHRTMWLNAAKAVGLTIVSDEVVAEMKPDFKNLWLRILKTKPDIILFAHEPASALKALRQYPYQGVFISAQALEEVLVNKSTPNEITEGALTITTEQDRSYSEAFQKKFSTVPLLESHSGYEAIMSLLEASEKNRANLTEGIRLIQRTSVAGHIDLSRQCKGSQPRFVVKQIRNGVLVHF